MLGYHMFTVAQRKKLVSQLRQPIRLKELRDSAEKLMRGTRYQYAHTFIQALEDEGIVKMHTLRPKTRPPMHVYSSAPLNEVSPYDLAVSLLPNGYFCNLSAVYYHNLTNQVPNTVYWCQETSAPRKGRSKQQLTEARIRSAFVKPSHHTSFVVKHNDHDIVVIERARGTDHGVVTVRRKQSPCPAGSRVATLERALIDAVVSPHYNGGITSLCEYFRAAKGRLKTQKLLEVYRKLEFVYPYAQAIGFFMDHAGMPDHAEELRRVYPPRQRFYVDHGARSTWIYDERWMISYPKGLVDDN
jgi:hypothetical protein